MSMVKCRDCGEAISAKAASCPKCGCPQEKSASIVWTTVNSPIVIFLLSSVFISFITWLYSNWKESNDIARMHQETVLEATTELSYRYQLIDKLLSNDNMTGQDAIYAFAAFRGKPPFSGAVPKYSDVGVPAISHVLSGFSVPQLMIGGDGLSLVKIGRDLEKLTETEPGKIVPRQLREDTIKKLKALDSYKKLKLLSLVW